MVDFIRHHWLNLAELNLNGCNIDDIKWALFLCNRLNFNSLTKVTVRENKIKDAGSAMFDRFPKLRHIDFGNTKVYVS